MIPKIRLPFFIISMLAFLCALVVAVPLLQAAPPREGVVIVAAANLRNGPGTDHLVIGNAFAGERLQLIACNQDCSWYQLANGAWIAAFLVTDAPNDLPDATQIVTSTANVAPAIVSQSSTLEALASNYLRTARANIRTIGNQLAIVPSPIYANGIYARDAFFTVVGLDDPALSEQSYRWFEGAQNPQNGQITTAIPLDPADHSLQPQDDETTLLFLIWTGLMVRDGKPVDSAVVSKAWGFVQSHVHDDLYLSAPGQFRYWADCWHLDQPDTITYDQGLYAIAARFMAEANLAGVTSATADQAAYHYRALYRSDLGFLPLSANAPGNRMQDLSALLPEFLHRYFFSSALLPDSDFLSTINHQLNTATIYATDGTPAGIKIIANADGSFADPANFACPTLNSQGDYHNGGYWPMYTLVDLAIAYRLDPQPAYRSLIETLVAKELADGSPKEYWPLAPGRVGALQPGRGDYSWNVLAVPALRWAGLIR